MQKLLLSPLLIADNLSRSQAGFILTVDEIYSSVNLSTDYAGLETGEPCQDQC